MIYPNFYIVGAPKAGTTSLYHYLDQHPEIAIPDKEPRFFIKESIEKTSDSDPIKPYLLRSSVLNENDYSNLYADKKEKVRCDASTQYLYHFDEVIPKIKQLNSDSPKILILLRNPIERAFSNYSHNYSTYENLDFEEALQQESERISKGFNSFWHYKGLSTYADSVKAYKEAFKEVKVILFEDFIKDIDKSLVDIFNFLEVDSNFKVSHFMINKKSTGAPKSKKLNVILQNSSKFSILKTVLYKVIGEQRTKLFRELVMRKNLSKSKISLDESLKSKLESYFVEDIAQLKEILPEQNIGWLNNGTNS
ncbi:MAG: sulfotransferase [Flavobacteriales bacterium]|nr:sulfotransferase [Flavobacteriales bacterium]